MPGLYRIFIVFAVFLLLPGGTAAQDFQKYKFIDASSGLLHPSVTGITQDPMGFMWFATANGLVRYDGHTFLTYTVQNSKLSSSHIDALLIDRNGYLWIGTEKGIDRMDLRNHHIENIRLQKCNPARLDNYIISLFQSSDGTIWAGTGKSQLFRCHENEKVAYQVCLKGQEVFFPIKISLEDKRNGTIWIRSGLYAMARLDIKTNKIVKEYALGTEGYNILESPKFGLVVFTISGLYQLNKKTDTFEPMNLGKEVRRSYNAFSDHKNNLWITRDNYHFYRYDGQKVENHTTMFEHFQHNLYRINCFYEDKQHNLWVGTTRGIVCFNIPDNRFMHYGISPGSPLSVRSITETDNGEMYIGGYEFLIRYDRKNDDRYYIGTDTFTPYVLIPEGEKLWLLTEGRGLRKYNVREKKLYTHYKWRKVRRPGSYLIAGFKDHDGLFWLSDYSTTMRYDEARDSVISFNKNINGIQLENVKTLQFYESRDRHLWLATNLGLIELDQHRNPVRTYSAQGGNGMRLSNTYIYNVLEDSEGFIWIATAFGFNRLDRRTGRITSYTTEDGLADNVVVAMLEDNQHRLWLATHNGLSMFDIASGKFRNFHTEDGLSSNEFNHGAFYKGKNGMLYFGGLNGINAFFPDKFMHGQVNIPLLLSEVKTINDDDQTTSYVFNSDEPVKIDLPSDNRFCRITFALADYTRSEKNLYSYKLEGYDERWINIGNQPYIHFTALPPGNYKVLIKAAGSNGIWTSDPLCILLHIEKPFYNTWWFAVSILAALGLLVYLVFMIRIRQVKKLADIRIKIASDLHDEVGSVLTRVAMQAELMRLGTEEQRPGMLSAIMESCRTAMSSMRDVVWSIDARNDALSNLIDRMNGHITQMSAGSRFSYSFEYDDSISRLRINPNDRQNIYLIFKEAVNNIFKHSSGDEISIRFFKKDKLLYLVVKDNGHSVKNNLSGGGTGIKNMKMRAATIKAELFIVADDTGFRVGLRKKIK